MLAQNNKVAHENNTGVKCHKLNKKMDLRIVAITQFIALTMAIEVYEEISEPVFYSRFIRNPKYDQQDLQKLRYYQQQQFDANNRHLIIKRQARLALAPEVTYFVPQKTKTINFDLNHDNNMKLLHESFGGLTTHNNLAFAHNDDKIFALTDLIGKAPSLQLQGLEHILNTKDHTPIAEDLVDVENPQVRPNIKVEHENENKNWVLQSGIEGSHPVDLSQIEKELNDAAQVEAENILVKARNEAEAHVRAQHEAIARAQVQAQNAALVNAQLIPAHIENSAPVHNLVDVHFHNSKQNNLQYASQYAFGYRVRDNKSGNSFGHEEKHDGKTTKGNYHVLLPDGRMQVVNYWADKTGFHAKVTYDKAAKH